MKKDLQKQIDAEFVAERVKLLWGFLSDFIPYKEMLKEVSSMANDRHSTALAMAPIFGAFGQDWEEKDMQTKINLERANALYSLVNVLDETEKQRIGFYQKQENKKAGLEQLNKALGL